MLNYVGWPTKTGPSAGPGLLTPGTAPQLPEHLPRHNATAILPAGGTLAVTAGGDWYARPGAASYWGERVASVRRVWVTSLAIWSISASTETNFSCPRSRSTSSTVPTSS